MAKKEKKIPVSALKGTMSQETVTIPLDGADGVDVVVQKTIPLQEVMQFVADVVASCVDEADGRYMPGATVCDQGTRFDQLHQSYAAVRC